MSDIRIVAAAVRWGTLVISRPAPMRHADILRELFRKIPARHGDLEEGFLGSNGHFYGRGQAKQIVRDAHQHVIAETHPVELYSEDLW